MHITRVFALSVGLLLTAACVSMSTASDRDAVRATVLARAQLPVTVRAVDTGEHAADPEQQDPDVVVLASQPMTLQNAVRIALLNNRSLRASLLELGVARGQLVQASLFPNPEIEAQTRISQDPTQDPQWDFGVGIDITSIILRGQRQGVAQADVEVSRARAAGATLDLGYQVRLAYYDLLANEQLVELARTALQSYVASYDTARTLHEAGNITDLQLYTEQVAYEGSRVMVAEAEADLVDARERLNVLLGFFGRDTAWQNTGRLEDPPATLGSLVRLESRAIEASVELAEHRSRLLAAARRVGLTQTIGWLPDLTLGLHAEHDGTFWEVGPALTGRLPVFDRQQGNVISRQAELDAGRERYVGTAIQIRASVRAARARALTAQARARMYRDTMLPLRARILQQTVLQYNAMTVGVFQVLQARREQLETGRMYIATVLDYWRSRAALEQLLAGRLAGTIATGTEGSMRSVLAGGANTQSVSAGH